MNIGLIMGDLIKSVGKQIATSFIENEKGIPMESYMLLNILYEQDNIILHDLANIMKKDKSGVLRQIDALEKQKLVVRIADSEDRRKKTITLTKEGVKKIERLREIEATIFNNLLKGVPEKDLKIFESVLNTMRSKIS